MLFGGQFLFKKQLKYIILLSLQVYTERILLVGYVFIGSGEDGNASSTQQCSYL